MGFLEDLRKKFKKDEDVKNVEAEQLHRERVKSEREQALWRQQNTPEIKKARHMRAIEAYDESGLRDSLPEFEKLTRSQLYVLNATLQKPQYYEGIGCKEDVNIIIGWIWDTPTYRQGDRVDSGIGITIKIDTNKTIQMSGPDNTLEYDQWYNQPQRIEEMLERAHRNPVRVTHKESSYSSTRSGRYDGEPGIGGW